MGHFLILLSLIFSLNVSAAVTPNGIPQIQIGAIGTTSSASAIAPSSLAGANGIFTLYGGDLNPGGALTTENYYVMYQGGNPYRVTSGKTAYCFDFRGGSGSGFYFQIVYNTANAFTNNSASAPAGTNVYQSGAGSGKYPLGSSGVASLTTQFAGEYNIPSQGYVAIQIHGTNGQYAAFQMECFEQ
jgi:hypothetical protein